MNGIRSAPARIIHSETENDEGFIVSCVLAICELGESKEMAYGSSDKSVRRALYMLSKNCSCGCKWHHGQRDGQRVR